MVTLLAKGINNQRKLMCLLLALSLLFYVKNKSISQLLSYGCFRSLNKQEKQVLTVQR